MAMLPVKEYSSKQFTWNVETGHFVACASDLSRTDFWSRIYDDACDVGFAIVSERTGKSVVFYLAEQEHNGDEITNWNFLPLNNEVCPEGVMAVVFND